MKVLMVDVDGVLIHGRPHDGLPYHTDIEADLGLSFAAFQREFFGRHWHEIIVGHRAIEPCLTEVLSRIAPHVETEILLSYWFRNDSRLDRALIADLKPLRRQGVKLNLATNQEHRRAKWLMSEHGLNEHFSEIIYSAGVGHKKPSTEFFSAATVQAGVAVEDIGFIDDTAENVEAARAFGWRAKLWTEGMTLQDALTELFPGSPIRL
jgi:putative hydrolase of the HAD superfamily